MSLVGSLEDLGLGDILQIVSLARKSGRLLLRTDGETGRIVVCDGLVRGASIKGDSQDLRGLLLSKGELTEAQFERASALAEDREIALVDAVVELGAISAERLESLRREHVERCVMRMFGWLTGEFSFEVHEQPDPEDQELLLPNGINTQYLAMEATRLRDEGGLLGAPLSIELSDDDELAFSGEDEAPDAADRTQPLDSPVEALALASAQGALDEPEDDDITQPEGPPPGREETRALAKAMLAATGPHAEQSARAAIEAAPATSAEDPESAPPAPMFYDSLDTEASLPVSAAIDVAESPSRDPVEVDVEVDLSPAAPQDPPPLVALDRNLPGLEWLKLCVGEAFPRVHLFQNGEAGMDRIRRYLARGVAPMVALSPQLLESEQDQALLLARMRTLAPEMRIFALKAASDRSVPGGFDGSLLRPDRLAPDPDLWPLDGRLATALREGLFEAARRASSRRRARPRQSSPLEKLRSVSDRLRDPGRQDDVLSLVLEFASRELSRVAVFMMRDDAAVGMAQCGMPKAGGPDDEALREIRLPREALPELFRQALESRRGVRGRISEPDVGRLSQLLGGAVPDEAYAAPIESGGCVAALIYGDNLPVDTPIVDTTALEIVLHEAGLALDRALLERALADARAEAP